MISDTIWAPAIISYICVWLTQSLTWWCQRCIVLCVILTILYFTGWLHRFLWFMAEREATKILNGTTVTSSTFHIDILRGKVWISNLIIHAPKQDTWQWEAPVFARIGKVYVEANLVSCLFSLWFLWEELPLDIYTILVSDIQVFIERKHNVYNFLLLDPHVVVPVPPQPTVTASEAEEDEDDLVFVNPILDDGDGLAVPIINAGNKASRNGSCDATTKDSVSADINSVNSNDEEEKAQHVVEHIVHSVRRAAVAGGDKNPVVTLLDQYRHVLSNQLKNFTTEKDNATKASTTAMMQEGVNLIKNVTANIAEKTVQAQQVIIPARRTLPGERPVYGRVGRLLIQEMRIFVRENHRLNTNESASSSVSSSSKGDASKNAASNDDNINDPASPISAWHPPIVIQHVSIRANEFCPPLTAKEKMKSKKVYDENVDNYDPTLMPALYQTMDAYVDIIWKRVLAEVAKSNTGQFFQTAMGEVVNLFVESKEPIQDDIAS
jgi:hypothetical protein